MNRVSKAAMAELKEAYARHLRAGLLDRIRALRTLIETGAFNRDGLVGDHVRVAWRRERAAILRKHKLPAKFPVVEARKPRK